MKKKLAEISELFFYSKIKQELPNLVIKTQIRAGKAYFVIGTYSFDSVSGVSKVSNIIPEMNYNTCLYFLKSNQ
jgi:hypothetical protein